MRVDFANPASKAAQITAYRAHQQGSITVAERRGTAGLTRDFQVRPRGQANSAPGAQQTPAPAQASISAPVGASPNASPNATLERTSKPVAAGTYGQAHLDAILASWGATSGTERFQAAADVDGSGTIDFRDVTFVHTNWGRKAPSTPGASPETAPRTYGQQNVDAALRAFGATKGDERFSATADADGNGVVDFKDVTFIHANWGRTIATG